MKKIIIAVALLTLNISSFGQSRQFAMPTNGYRGFAGYDINIGIGEFQYDRFALTTAHGFQVDNIFVGMGASLQFSTTEIIDNDYYYYDDEEIPEFMMPFFIDIQYEMCHDKPSMLKPFTDLKLGYSVGDACGLFVQPTIGIRIAHINIWAGYNLIQDKTKYYEYEYQYITEGGDQNKKLIAKNDYYQAITFGLTFDWGARNKD